ncbi:hypothetical protein B9Z55_008692 [Caenorhabditis nigoni]|uniref:Uncharacterized protein n=1 Tax=Caenorhabditis nigoni TaxID=1611254 RepID=A0A2G5UNN0_9PELO|nr:hypothetical protein B9Z55_008692 [Caenorhabditis nigoni]
MGQVFFSPEDSLVLFFFLRESLTKKRLRSERWKNRRKKSVFSLKRSCFRVLQEHLGVSSNFHGSNNFHDSQLPGLVRYGSMDTGTGAAWCFQDFDFPYFNFQDTQGLRDSGKKAGIVWDSVIE